MGDNMQTATTNPEQETALSIECQIEAQPEYQLGKPITVKGILHNSGAAALWILRRSTFLQPHCGDCLLVTHNGSSVSDIGISVVYGAPTAESYLRIPAGESVEAQIDLSENYTIREAGDYEVSFRLAVLGIVETGDAKPPESPDQLKLVPIESKKVTFRAVGSGSTRPLERPDIAKPEIVNLSSQSLYPPEPRMPSFANMSEQEQRDYYWAHRTAYRKIRASLDRLNKDNTQRDFWYRAWFEHVTPPKRRGTVADNLARMANWMVSQSFPPPVSFVKTTEGNCTMDNVFAWSIAGDRKINLCHRAFTDSVLTSNAEIWGGGSKEWFRAFIVIHEVSHAAVGTTDKPNPNSPKVDYYSPSQCTDLATSHPDWAVKNAQNYAIFAMRADTFHDSIGDPDLKTGDHIRLKANNGGYLNTSPHGGSDYIVAEIPEDNRDIKECKFTVTVTKPPNKTPPNTSPTQIKLQSWDNKYLNVRGDGNYVMTDVQDFGDPCVFEVSLFAANEYNSGPPRLVLMATNNGKLWCQTNQSPPYVMPTEDDVTAGHCLFTLKKILTEAVLKQRLMDEIKKRPECTQTSDVVITQKRANWDVVWVLHGPVPDPDKQAAAGKIANEIVEQFQQQYDLA
jgi:hypothetical protein